MMKRKYPALWVFCFGIFCIIPVLASAAEEKNTSAEQKKVDPEAYPNKSLVQAAWDSYNDKDYKSALSYAERCIALYDTAAKKMQASLRAPIPKEKINSCWVLNDVATAKFIQARIFWLEEDKQRAKRILSDIAQNYRYAMSYDVRGWYWSVSSAAKDMLKAIDLGIDFGDSSSSYLASKAWEAYNKKDYKGVLGYAEQCIRMYREIALWQQKSLTRYPGKEEIAKYWALNDVGTCYYLAGKASRKLGQPDKAREYFNFLKKNLYFASCWDPKGWHWKIVNAL